MTGERTVLVTGGAGYVGSLVAEDLLARGDRVRVLDALVHGGTSSLLHLWGHERFTFVRGDLCDPQARAAALRGADAVVHLAAVVGDPACARQPELARSVNLDGTRGLLDEAEAAGVRRFVFASTCSHSAKKDSSAAELATEEWPLRPVSLYAETKVAAELDVLGRSADGFVTTCLRLATVYGPSPRMRFDLTVNEFTRDALLKRELVVYGEQFWRPYVHVRDAARAVAEVLASPEGDVAGEVFNVGGTDQNFRKLDLLEVLARHVPGVRVDFVRQEDDPRDYRVSFEKVRGRLGFVPARSLEDGVRELKGVLESGLIADPYDERYRN